MDIINIQNFSLFHTSLQSADKTSNEKKQREREFGRDRDRYVLLSTSNVIIF